jgi:hypothetical protein
MPDLPSSIARECREIFAGHVVKTLAVRVVGSGQPLRLRDVYFNWVNGEIAICVDLPIETDEVQSHYGDDVPPLGNLSGLDGEPLSMGAADIGHADFERASAKAKAEKSMTADELFTELERKAHAAREKITVETHARMDAVAKAEPLCILGPGGDFTREVMP